MNKRISLQDAVAKVKDGMTVMVGGFLAAGSPITILDELAKSGVKDLTLICNDTAYADVAHGKLITNKQVKKVIVSHIGTNPNTSEQMNSGELEIEFAPQGTLAERVRAAGAGLGGVLTTTGMGTVVAQGKEIVNVDGKDYYTSAVFPEGVVKSQYDAYSISKDEWRNMAIQGQGGTGPKMANDGGKEVLGGNREVTTPRLVYEMADHEYESDAVSLMPYVVIVRENLELNYYLQGLSNAGAYSNKQEISPSDLSAVEPVRYSTELNRYNYNMPNSGFKSELKEDQDGNDVVGLEGMLYYFAKCCTPVPGEPIVGVVTRSKGVSIHRVDCASLDNVPEERMIDIKWADKGLNKTYIASIRIDVQDKLGILKDIMIELSECNTNIAYANIKSNSTKKIGIIELGIEVDNINRLKSVIVKLQSIPEVISVKRIQGVSSSKSDKSNTNKKRT